MAELFEMKPIDRKVYETELAGFLPERIIDIHTHVWSDALKTHKAAGPRRTVSWPHLVAKDCSAEDLIRTYELMFAGKKVTPLMFSSVEENDDMDVMNRYVSDASRRTGFPALCFSHPSWSADDLERKVTEGGFRGLKSYLSLTPRYLPRQEIRIYDFFPPHQLAVADRLGWVVMLHIPRDGRLRDPVNVAQMLEIDSRFPRVRLIIAHVGRAYCPEDVGDSLDILAEKSHMVFDFAANTNDWVFEKLIRAVGPKRILFGSDLPILRMRMKRICEKGLYINVVPEGLYGDVSGDKNMRAVPAAEAKDFTFFMYEELLAFKRAAERTGLSRADLEAVFYGNAARILGL